MAIDNYGHFNAISLKQFVINSCDMIVALLLAIAFIPMMIDKNKGMGGDAQSTKF